MRVVTLVGLSGAGKSTVGRRLAARWGWEAWDLDDVIEARAGERIATIFDKLGESGFRRLEAEALEEALGRARLVLATGGGAPCQPGAMDAILAAGPAVWLRARPETLARRLAAANDRPLLAGPDRVEALARMLAARAPHYARATVAIDVDGLAADDVVARVEDALGRPEEGT